MGGLCGSFPVPIPAPIPLPRRSPPRKQKSPQQPPWVTCFPEALVLAFRARLHRHAQAPVGARHCGLGRRKGSAKMGHSDCSTESRRGAEGGGGGWNSGPAGLNATTERARAPPRPAVRPRPTSRPTQSLVPVSHLIPGAELCAPLAFRLRLAPPTICPAFRSPPTLRAPPFSRPPGGAIPGLPAEKPR